MFYWLPPMVPAPATGGTFHPGAKVRLSIVQVPPSPSKEIASFSVGGPPGRAIIVEPHIQAYVATWRTSQCNTGPCRLEPNRRYQIVALVSPAGPHGHEFVAGVADAWIVRSAKDLAAVDPTQYVGVVNGGTLSIRFRIERGMIGSLQIQPDSLVLAVGQTFQLTANVFDIDGNAVANYPPTWAAPPSVVTVSPTGLVTAIGQGISGVIAHDALRGATATVTVVPANTELPPTLLTPTNGVRILQDNPASGCALDPVAGYGFKAPLTWTRAAGPKPLHAHHVLVEHPPTGTVLVNAYVFIGNDLNMPGCGVRIPNANLDGWQWRVRAVYSDFMFGPWSTARTLGFLTPDVSSDLTMQPPNYGAGRSQVSLSGYTDLITTDVVRIESRMRTSSTVFTPPGVEYFYSEQAAFDAYYRSLGPSTGFNVFDQGFQRFWQQWLSWNPGLPALPGPTRVIATVVDPSGNRVISNREVVNVVP